VELMLFGFWIWWRLTRDSIIRTTRCCCVLVVPVAEYEAGLRKIIKYLARRGGYVGSNATVTSTDADAGAAADGDESSSNEALTSGRVRLLLLTPPPVDEVTR
jgi:hypothetical protein